MRFMAPLRKKADARATWKNPTDDRCDMRARVLSGILASQARFSKAPPIVTGLGSSDTHHFDSVVG
jgi:hypothetical protein